MRILKSVLLILMVSAIASCSSENKESKVANVDQVINEPGDFIDRSIVVKGVVNKVNMDKNIFSIISEREFDECGIGECNVNDQLPVRYSGELPELGEKLKIAGIVKKNDEGFIYEAESIRTITNL